jgi:hypothetical protein
MISLGREPQDLEQKMYSSRGAATEKEGSHMLRLTPQRKSVAPLGLNTLFCRDTRGWRPGLNIFRRSAAPMEGFKGGIYLSRRSRRRSRIPPLQRKSLRIEEADEFEAYFDVGFEIYFECDS